MRVRDYETRDFPRVKELYQQQGFEYELPNFEEGQFVVRQVVADESDTVVLALFARKTVELFLIGDKGWQTPLWRFHALGALHKTMKTMLNMMGFHDAHIWVPPQLEKSFGRRLMKCFGWKRNLWTDYVREVK